jgi:hypothetical protein
MRDNILLTYVFVDILFVITGGLLIIFALTTESEISQTPTVATVARDLLLAQCPLTGRCLRDPKSTLLVLIENQAAIGNAIVVFVTFLISVPAMVMPMTRGWLKLHGYMTVVCAMFTMIIGLTIWFDTLKTRTNLSIVWNTQPNSTQSLLQQEVRRNWV